MSASSAIVVSFLVNWSLRWAILIAGLALLLWIRPPQSISARLLLGRLVLLAGLLLPLTPTWWRMPWPATGTTSTPAVPVAKSQPTSSEELSTPQTSASPRVFGAHKNPENQVNLPTVVEPPGKLSEELAPTTWADGPDHKTDFLGWIPGTYTLLMTGWLVIACFGFLRLGLGMYWLILRKREARPVSASIQQNWLAAREEIGCARDANLLASNQVRTPALLGGFHPTVLIPSNWDQTSVQEQRIAFLHEWTHIHHRDDWAHFLEEIIRSLFFFHPLVHWLLNRLGVDREQRCDAVSLYRGVSADSLAQVLLTQARKLGTGNASLAPPPAILFFHPKSAKERIEKLMEADLTRWTRPLSRFRSCCATLVVICLTLALGGAGSAVANLLPEANTPVQASPHAVTITGTVTLPDGKPAPKALVWAAKLELSPLVRRETRTDASGNFQLSMDPGQWLVWASSGTMGGEPANLGNSMKVLEIPGKEKPNPLKIVLEERGLFRGQLTHSETGKPIQGAKIFLDNAMVLETDAEGKWELGGLKRHHHESFFVAPGFQRKRILFDTTKSTITHLNISLAPGGLIKGKVTDSAGKPIPGAWVGRSTSGSYFSLHGLFQTCDSDGNFEFWDAVEPGQPTNLSAYAHGFKFANRNNLVSERGRSLDIQFELLKLPPKDSRDSAPGDRKKRQITGKIVTPEGKPVAGVLVQWGLNQFGPEEQPNTRSREDGGFTLFVPDEDNTLTVIPKNFTPEFIPVSKNGDKTVPVTLSPGTSVTGIVKNARGKPVEGVMVLPVLSVGAEEPNACFLTWLDENQAKTDANGKFVLNGLAKNIHFDFLKEGYTDLRTQKLAPAPIVNEVKILPGGALKGKVVDSQGNPIRNFRITVNQPTTQLPFDKLDGYFAGYSGMGVYFTSEDGTFVLTGVGVGNHLRVKAHAEGHGEAVVDRFKSISVDELETAPATVIQAAKPSTLQVKVLRDGKPVAQARVTLVDGQKQLDQHFSWGYHNASWENMVNTTTGNDGLAHFKTLSFSGATLLVEAPGCGRRRVPWRKKEKEITVQLEPEAILEGQINLKPGDLATDFHGMISHGKGDVINFGADIQGKFQIRQLPAGDCYLLLPSGKIHQKLQLEAGKTTSWREK